MKITLGTRGSELAVGQAQSIAAFLVSMGHEVYWRRFTTHGDRWQAGPLDKLPGSGFFTRELESALLEGEVDLLVHSFKDVALERPAGIIAACVPPREDPGDWLVTRLDAPSHPVIGTSSERRARFLRASMPEAVFTWIRGNVPTRVQHVRNGALRGEPLHGTVLAAAGLRRLNLDLSDVQVWPLSFEELLPAPAQGALLVETREDRTEIVQCLSALHDPLAERCVRLERSVLAGLGGGCQLPLGALAQSLSDGRIHLRAAFASEEGIKRGEAIGTDDAALAHSVLTAIV